jgi:hypothetical protein
MFQYVTCQSKKKTRGTRGQFATVLNLYMDKRHKEMKTVLKTKNATEKKKLTPVVVTSAM